MVKRNGQETPMKEGRDVWWNDFVSGQSGSCETLPMDVFRSALHPLHRRRSRQATRHSAYPWRHERRPGVHHFLGLRYQGYRCLLVHSRYRMDHRTQLHRLRAAVPGCDEHHVRGLARLSRLRPVVQDHRGLRSLSDLHRAYRHQDVHERGTRLASEV